MSKRGCGGVDGPASQNVVNMYGFGGLVMRVMQLTPKSAPLASRRAQETIWTVFHPESGTPPGLTKYVAFSLLFLNPYI